MATVVHLLWPRWRAVAATWSRGERVDRLKYLFFATLGFAFWSLIYALARVLLRKVAGEEVYGDFLLGKLLSFLGMLFFAILVFSNLVTSLSSFFLAEDLPIAVTSPVPTGTLFIARFVETAVASSWMVLLFAIPILVAYGKVLGASWVFYPWMAAALVAFLLVPAAIGTVIAIALVSAFPARRVYDVVIILVVLLISGLYLLFRLVRPELLFNPDVFHGFAEYFATLKTPDSYLAPATWFAQTVLSALHRNWTDGLFYLGVLLANGLMAVLVVQGIAQWRYAEAYSRAQEGRRTRLTTRPEFEGLIAVLAAAFSGPTREALKKDLRSFFRETMQWTQLLMLVGLIVVYLFNFKVLNLERIAGLTAYHVNLVAFLNIVLASFVIAAVSVRFVLPLISLEGQAIWIVRTAPVSIRAFVWGKFLLAIFPLLVVAEVLILVSDYFLSASPFLFAVSAAAIFVLTIGTTALAVGVGAIYPNFKEQNIARLSTGASSIIYMIQAMFYVVACVTALFFPTRRIYETTLSGLRLPTEEWVFIGGCVAAVLVLTFAVVFVAMRRGVRSLETMEL
jgi:ABC-2 type transport system permease protein